MTLPSARIIIPLEWGTSARCPICAANPLNVIHPLQRPDQLQCPHGGAEFEIEQGGARIRFNALPAGLQSALAGRWVTMAEVQAQVEILNPQPESPVKTPALTPDSLPTATANENQPASAPFVPQANISAPAADAQLVAQARDLYALGNSVPQIHTILGRTQGLNPADLDAILADVSHQDRKKHSRQTRNLIIAAFVSLVVVFCCVAIFYLSRLPISVFQNSAKTGNSPAATSQSSTFNLANLPDPMKTLMPDEMTVVNASPPVIIPGTVADTDTYPCPKSADQASQLFGGLTENWTYQQGWFMVSKTPATLHVPAGMMVGYFVFNPVMQMKSVSGPITMQNIYMVVISCD